MSLNSLKNDFLEMLELQGEISKYHQMILQHITMKKIKTTRYEELESRVHKWAKDKGILEKATLVTQAYKTREEAEELLDASLAKNEDGYRDALGDVLVTIIIGAKMSSNNLMDCLEDVLNIIEKRTGTMQGGSL